MGAEIIKVEIPGVGDWSRDGGHAPELSKDGMGLSYITQNANKKSIALDLKSEKGLEVAKKLIASADVFVENFKPGTITRLGLSFDEVKKLNPKIVYCSISAYGQDGPISHRPAYDHVVQGMCGIMKTTGTPDGEPTKVGAPYIDYSTGMNASLAIVSALHEVRRTDNAVSVDVAMLDTSLILMASLMTNNLTAGWKPEPSGNEAWSQSPSSGAFDTSDGMLMIAANNDPQFQKLCAAIDRSDILQDPRWAEPEERKKHTSELRQELVKTLKTKSAREWEDILDAVFVPAARVRNLDETLAEGQAKARGIMTELRLESHDMTIHVPSLGFKANGDVIAASSAPPALGENADEILQSIGMADDAIAELRAESVI